MLEQGLVGISSRFAHQVRNLSSAPNTWRRSNAEPLKASSIRRTARVSIAESAMSPPTSRIALPT
jgi:hypothetical protein